MPFETVDTPAVLIDTAIVDRNIAACQNYFDSHGIALRPHIKTHKLPEFARRQIAAGAVGITCQKIGEAEIMAAAGCEDILITYNILGEAKLARLKRLAGEISLAVVADNDTVIDGLAATFAGAGPTLGVMVECETGAERCGVGDVSDVVRLARRIADADGLEFRGLMTYPPPGNLARVQSFFTRAKEACTSAGLDCPVISNGGSPDMWHVHEAPVVTEHRPGTYIYNDRKLITQGACRLEDCALTVLATVASTPAPDRAVIDAGSKVLTSDLSGLEHHGLVLDHPELVIARLTEEHGVIRAPSGATGLAVGDRVRIVPNHVCVVSNMLDTVVLHENGTVTGTTPVAARGRVN